MDIIGLVWRIYGIRTRDDERSLYTKYGRGIMNHHSDAERVIVGDPRGGFRTDIRPLSGHYDVKWYDREGLRDW